MVNFRWLCNKKRLAVIGSGALAGFLFFTKVLPIGTASKCAASCVERNPSYRRLQQNEAVLNLHHPRICSVYVNHLPSNSPSEDRHVVGGWRQDCTGLFGVIDGHGTGDCSEHLKNVLLKHVTSVFIENDLIESSDVKEYSTASRPAISPSDNKDEAITIQLKPDNDGVDNQCTLREGVEEALQKSFVSLDNQISEEALKCVRLISKGRSIKEEGMMETIMRSIAGACALLTLVSADDIFVANTGDCRAVLGTKKSQSGKWLALPLSADQNAENEEEVSRLKLEHPGEESTVILMNRLLGGLMPFRSFGDVSFKWSKEDLEVVTQILPNYKTPPYLTAEPVVTRHVIDGSEKFLILASDGLWEKLTNKDAVRVVATSLYGNEKSGLFSFFSSSEECCEGSNPATNLLWEALGGGEISVRNMLDVPKEYRRMHRDDITIIVIQLK